MYSNYIPLPLPRLPLIALTDLLPSNYFFPDSKVLQKSHRIYGYFQVVMY